MIFPFHILSIGQHGLLASGGGTADKCIKFWNTLTGQPLQSVDTGSQVIKVVCCTEAFYSSSCLCVCWHLSIAHGILFQVCNLAWSKTVNELVCHITSHDITSHHIASHHITSHHITSHHITSRCRRTATLSMR